MSQIVRSIGRGGDPISVLRHLIVTLLHIGSDLIHHLAMMSSFALPIDILSFVKEPYPFMNVSVPISGCLL